RGGGPRSASFAGCLHGAARTSPARAAPAATGTRRPRALRDRPAGVRAGLDSFSLHGTEPASWRPVEHREATMRRWAGSFRGTVLGACLGLAAGVALGGCGDDDAGARPDAASDALPPDASAPD